MVYHRSLEPRDSDSRSQACRLLSKCRDLTGVPADAVAVLLTAASVEQAAELGGSGFSLGLRGWGLGFRGSEGIGFD